MKGKVQIAALFLISGLVSLVLSPGAFAQDAWVNEIHYDNTGGDTGEFVEIAGVAGTDLTGWTLVLYNGNGGGGYGTETLSGSLADDGSGFGFAAFFIAGIQNGSPDGLALVDPDGDVVQFLSYEGSFTAIGGPADGTTSSDIGVDEDPAPAAGNSLQLTGTGSTYADFSWSDPSTESPGAVNDGQTLEGSAEPNNDGVIPQQGNPASECNAIAEELGLDFDLEPIAKYEFDDGAFEFGGEFVSFDADPPSATAGSWTSTVPVGAFLIKQATQIAYWTYDPTVTSDSYVSPYDEYSHITFCGPGNTAELFPVRPILECVVDNGGGSYTARFGYLNGNDDVIEIPVGPNNKFSPAPQDRGQTTLFQPGRVGQPGDVGAFSVDFDGSNLVWTLEGPDGSRRTSTASANSKRCPTDECVPTDGPSWPSGVITNNGDGTGSVVIETPQGFKSISISGNNVALSNISNIPDGDLSESGPLSGDFSNGWTTITYTGTDKPTTITVVLTALNEGSSGFFIQVEDQCDISLRVDPEVDFGAEAMPQRVALLSNYPNPFNPTTVIPFDLPEAVHVKLAVYDMLGRRLVTLVDGVMPAGSHTATWEATNANGQAVPSGMYLYRLETDQESYTRRMLLVK